jgi:hypothetical protein
MGYLYIALLQQCAIVCGVIPLPTISVENLHPGMGLAGAFQKSVNVSGG